MLAGLYIIIAKGNLIKKMIGMTIFQTSILLFYISMGKIRNGAIPILKCLDFNSCPTIYSNPLPHVLMLTAIVVGVATLSVGLAIIVKIKEAYGTIEESAILIKDLEENNNE